VLPSRRETLKKPSVTIASLFRLVGSVADSSGNKGVSTFALPAGLPSCVVYGFVFARNKALTPSALSFVASHDFVASPHFIAPMPTRAIAISNICNEPLLAPSLVMPTGAHSPSPCQAPCSRPQVNGAEWRHLTHWMFTQLSDWLSYAPDFLVLQRASRVIHH
jgi:hypothetical protein